MSLDLFSAAAHKESIKARDAALALVEINSDEWFRNAIIELAEFRFNKPAEFTGENIRYWLTPLLGKPHTPKVWGALIKKAIKAKIIEKTGQYAQMRDEKSHGRETKIYRWAQ